MLFNYVVCLSQISVSCVFVCSQKTSFCICDNYTLITFLMSYVLCRCMYICRLGDFDVLNLPYPERLRGYRKKILERGMTVEEKKTRTTGKRKCGWCETQRSRNALLCHWMYQNEPLTLVTCARDLPFLNLICPVICLKFPENKFLLSWVSLQRFLCFLSVWAEIHIIHQ